MTRLRETPASLVFDEAKGSYQLRLAKDKDKRQCQTVFCRGVAAVDVDANGKITHRRRTCHKCRSVLYFANHQEQRAFHHLKDSARKRKIRFTLTFAQFLLIIKDTDYIAKRGRSPGCLQIDRMRSEAGYEFGNLRVIEASHNCGKGAHERGGHSLKEEDFEPDPF